MMHLCRERIVKEGGPSHLFTNPSDARNKLFIYGELQF
jgi:ABC-type histidine transport system ATPase subunit